MSDSTDSNDNEGKSPFLPIKDILDSPRPVLDHVLPGLISGTVGMLVSAGGLGKSMYALQVASSLACGSDLYGLLDSDPKQGTVLLISAEDPPEVLASRLHDISEFWAGYTDIIAENLLILPVYGSGFSVGTYDPQEGFKASNEMKQLWKLCKKVRPRLIIFDTLNRCLAGISENDNAAMGLVVSTIEKLLTASGAAALVLHHVSKNAALDGRGAEQQAARGAGALTDNARWQMNLVGMTEEDAEARGIEDRTRWVQAVHAKCNYGQKMHPIWFSRGKGGVLAFDEVPEPQQESRKRGKRSKNTKSSRKEEAEDVSHEIPW